MNEKREGEFTKEWEKYLSGVDYKTAIRAFSETDENWRYYLGDQWHGVVSNGLPTPVFNVIKPVIRYKVSTVMSNSAKILFRPQTDGISDDVTEEDEEIYRRLTKYGDRLWERLKLDYKNEEILTDAAVSGTGVSYWYYNTSSGEIEMETVDAVNLYVSDYNLSDIQSQKFVMIAFRRSLEDVKREARENKKMGLCSLEDDEIEKIFPDDDYSYQAGDMGKMESDEVMKKCLCILMMWRDEESGHIFMKKSVKSCTYFDERDTKMTRYPVALMTWEPVKNLIFGKSDVSGMVPNQQYINKIAAMMMLSTMYTAFPKMVYDADRVDNPSNQIGVAVAVNSSSGDPLRSIIDYITPASMSTDAYNMFAATITQTQALMGVSEAALGNIDPENTSGKAIIATMEAASMPLESVKRRFYMYLENIAEIWLDMIAAYKIGNGIFFDVRADVRIDVGPASRYSELAAQQTLDNLLSGGYISFADWAELSPVSVGIPKQRLLEIAQGKSGENAGEQDESKKIDELLSKLDEDMRLEVMKHLEDEDVSEVTE